MTKYIIGTISNIDQPMNPAAKGDRSLNLYMNHVSKEMIEKERKEKEAQIASIPIGTVMSGTVETLQNYGAFVKLENGLSGLVHVSQISQKRVKNPAAVLNVGDEVQVKVIGIKDGKISLSMKAEEIGTSLGDLFKNIQL